MDRPKSICRKPGCAALLDRPGYCPAHAKLIDPRENFRALDERKTTEQIAFYQSSSWKKTSLRHRAHEPLCRRCKAVGKVKAGEMVHHNPPLDELLAAGKNPYDESYLETLCNWHHLEELRRKRIRPAP